MVTRVAALSLALLSGCATPDMVVGFAAVYAGEWGVMIPDRIECDLLAMEQNGADLGVSIFIYRTDTKALPDEYGGLHTFGAPHSVISLRGYSPFVLAHELAHRKMWVDGLGRHPDNNKPGNDHGPLFMDRMNAIRLTYEQEAECASR